jgi:WD40 repeat protein
VSGAVTTVSRHRIEIVHESLLRAWPRLVRWQAQDEEGAVLRDQLKQAAHLWEEKSRSPDLLWSGDAFQEFELWRHRYPGKLTALEEKFAESMVHRARRRKRLRQIVMVSVVVGLSAVAAVIAVSRQQAVEEARRREAGELLALGRLELDDHPTAGLAYALASLETADNPATRRFAVETLAHGAAASVLPEADSVDFSHDGRWLATGSVTHGAHLWARAGGPPVFLGDYDGRPTVRFDSRGPLLSIEDARKKRVFSVPGTQPVEEFDSERSWVFPRASRFFSRVGDAVYTRTLGRGERRLLGHLPGASFFDVSPDGTELAYALGGQVFVAPVEDLDASPRLVGEHSAAVGWLEFASDDGRILSSDLSGEIRIWSVDAESTTLERTLGSGMGGQNVWVARDRAGSTLVAARLSQLEPPDVALVWDLNGPPDAAPLKLRNGRVTALTSLSLDPSGRWLATAHSSNGVMLWSLGGRRGRIIRGQAPPKIEVEFTPDGRWLASYSRDGQPRLWPLSLATGSAPRTLARQGVYHPHMALGPEGRSMLVTSCQPGPCRAALVPLDGGAPRNLPRASSASLWSPALSRDARLAAAGSVLRPSGNLIELWDLQSGEVRTLDPRVEGQECGTDPSMHSVAFEVEFTSDGRLLSAGLSGLRLWNLDDGTNALLRPCATDRVSLLGGSLEDRYLLAEADIAQKTSTLSFHDLRAGVSRELTSHGNAVCSVALDPKGEIAVTGSFDGVVRVGPVTDETPHLLYGHDLPVESVAVSPDGQWIASGGNDGTIRLWPMPTGRPLHTLPYGELLARLRSFTNLRVVPDEGSETGYRVEAGPFPGWAVQPEW